jgi:hypothetical protein
LALGFNAGQIETFPPGFWVEFVEGLEPMMGRLLRDLGVCRNRAARKRGLGKNSIRRLAPFQAGDAFDVGRVGEEIER